VLAAGELHVPAVETPDDGGDDGLPVLRADGVEALFVGHEDAECQGIETELDVGDAAVGGVLQAWVVGLVEEGCVAAEDVAGHVRLAEVRGAHVDHAHPRVSGAAVDDQTEPAR